MLAIRSNGAREGDVRRALAVMANVVVAKVSGRNEEVYKNLLVERDSEKTMCREKTDMREYKQQKKEMKKEQKQEKLRQARIDDGVHRRWFKHGNFREGKTYAHIRHHHPDLSHKERKYVMKYGCLPDHKIVGNDKSCICPLCKHFTTAKHTPYIKSAQVPTIQPMQDKKPSILIVPVNHFPQPRPPVPQQPMYGAPVLPPMMPPQQPMFAPQALLPQAPPAFPMMPPQQPLPAAAPPMKPFMVKFAGNTFKFAPNAA